MCQLAQIGQFTLPQSCKQAIGEYRRDVNPARAFLLDNYVQLEPHVKRGAKYLGHDEGYEYEALSCAELYQAYVQWSLDNGYRPLNAANFGKEVKRTFPNVNKQRVSKNGQRIQVYRSLAVREDAEIRYSMPL